MILLSPARLPGRPLRALGALVVACLVSTSLTAQGSGGGLSVFVYDADGAPLPQATVTAEMAGMRQARITDDDGRVVIPVPAAGRVELEVRRIGYAPATLGVTLPVERNRVEITLRRSAFALDTVRVRAERTFAGIVASSSTQLPIGGADVSMTGARTRVRTDSAGTFTLPIETQRTVTLSVSAKGFAPQVVIERIAPGQSREMLILLDAAGTVGNRMLQSQEDRGERLRWRGNAAGAVGGRELRASSARSLGDALRASPSATEKALIFDENACLFVNGDPRPGQTIMTFPTDDVALVEFYGDRDPGIRNLAMRWPRGQPCGSGVARSLNPSTARWIVIWTR